MEIQCSIIIPHYNSFGKLKRLLRSIPDNENIEIIVVDDKSKKDITKELLGIKLKNLKILKNKTLKKGAGVCRNIGLKNSAGKWILFADSDDFFLENFYKEIEKYFDSNLDIVYFPPKSKSELNNVVESKRHLYFAEITYKYAQKKSKFREKELKYGFVVPWSKMISSKLIKSKNIEFDEVMYGNDLYFSVLCGLYSKNIDASNNSIYVVTENENSLTKKKTDESYEVRIEQFLKYNRTLKEKGEYLYLLSTYRLVYLYSKNKKNYFLNINEVFKINNYLAILRKVLKTIN